VRPQLSASSSPRAVASGGLAHRWAVLVGWLVLCAAFVGTAFPCTIEAHDLDIDHLTLWTRQDARQLEGQVTLAPARTRDAPPPRQAVIDRLHAQVALHVDGVACRAQMEVRELWTRGGAVSGDIVMLRCPLPPGARQLVVSLGAELPRLAITVEYRDGRSPASVSTLLHRGESSAPLPLGGGALPAGWNEGEGAVPEERAPAPAPSSDGSPVAYPVASSPATRTAAAPTTVVAPPTPAPPTFAPPSALATLRSYARLGLEHILPFGLDHVLFVVGLVLGATRRRDVAIDVTLFTLAHSVTLALGAAGWVAAPSRITEPLITLSIAAVGLENVRAIRQGDSAVTTRRRAIAFGFGLLHGQGFATALLDAGIARESFLTALFGFNVGVEVAQLGVAVVVAAVLPRVSGAGAVLPRVVTPVSILLACVGTGWTAMRLLAPR